MLANTILAEAADDRGPSVDRRTATNAWGVTPASIPAVRDQAQGPKRPPYVVTAARLSVRQEGKPASTPRSLAVEEEGR